MFLRTRWKRTEVKKEEVEDGGWLKKDDIKVIVMEPDQVETTMAMQVVTESSFWTNLTRVDQSSTTAYIIILSFLRWKIKLHFQIIFSSITIWPSVLHYFISNWISYQRSTCNMSQIFNENIIRYSWIYEFTI